MTEFGLFSDEGCVERGFFTIEDALSALKIDYQEEDLVEAKELCPDHADDEQPKDGCEMCDAEDETCDHCQQEVSRDVNGYWVGADETSDCADSPRGHEVAGSSR